ncbi:MAG: hypothetical protein IT365_04460 [Candidatus Hydrogenedentes bacterium]|nr:hypothetical protein [Candidatus Hydrogenedentota bacterium]
MSRLNSMLKELDEVTLAQRIARPFDQTRLAYRPSSNSVRDYPDFTDILADYVQYVYRECVTPGSSPSRATAAGQGKSMLNQELRRQGGDAVSAYRDCLDSLNGGLRHILDVLCDAMKAEALEHQMRDVLDRYLPPDDWELRVRTVREFIDSYSPTLPGIDRNHPERYAKDVELLIRSLLQASRQMASVFRRI